MSGPAPRFRRPAPLYASVAEQLPGDPDPATASDLAHSSASALLDGVFHSEAPEVVQRVLTLATLPGALWRLYVLHTWSQRAGDEVARRYREGSRTVPGLRYLSGLSEPPDVDEVRRTMDDILRGAFTGDLGMALVRAGAVATIVAHGTAHLADRADEDAEALTAQAGRLLSTGEELVAAGRRAETGELD